MAESVWPFLERRFPAGQYALLQEVSDAAGFSRSRSADGIAMSLWPSRGLGIEGIEIKSFRGDWLRELKQPEKAENIFKYCDRWWLVTADDTVAKLEEIPPTWGWMSIKGKQMRTMKEAPSLNPVPIDKSFIAAMMKRATKGMVPVGSIADKIAEAKELGKTEALNDRPWELEQARKSLKELQEDVTSFEQASGLKITGWRPNPKKIGEAVRFIEEGGLPSLYNQLIGLKNSSDRINKAISDGLAASGIAIKEEAEEQ